MAQKKITVTVDTQLYKTLAQIARLKKDDVNAVFEKAAQQYVLENSCLLAEEIERLQKADSGTHAAVSSEKFLPQEKSYKQEGSI